MRFFNKDSDIIYSEFIKNPMVCPDLRTCFWVSYSDLPKEEQTTDTKNMDGMLKTLTYKEAWAEYWTRASDSDKKFFMTLPNWTPEIFEEITGINTVEVSLKGKTVKVEINGKSYDAIIQ